MNDQRVISKLIEIAQNPQAPMDRRKRAIGWLSRSNDPKVLKFLQELLIQKGRFKRIKTWKNLDKRAVAFFRELLSKD